MGGRPRTKVFRTRANLRMVQWESGSPCKITLLWSIRSRTVCCRTRDGVPRDDAQFDYLAIKSSLDAKEVLGGAKNAEIHAVPKQCGFGGEKCGDSSGSRSCQSMCPTPGRAHISALAYEAGRCLEEQKMREFNRFPNSAGLEEQKNAGIQSAWGVAQRQRNFSRACGSQD